MLVNEIFRSISGEVGVIPQGAITWFIRFQRCNLHCSWCDSERARRSDLGTRYSVSQIVDSIPRSSNVILTGGEPLLQSRHELISLIYQLTHYKDCEIQIESNGSILPVNVFPVTYVMDYKTPSSGMQGFMIPGSYFSRGFGVEYIKFIVKDTVDLKYTVNTINCLETIYTPQSPRIAISIEGDWTSYITEYLGINLPSSVLGNIVFNFQLHKFLNLP